MVIYRHKDKYSISEMCRFFEVSRSGYYDYVKRIDVPAKDLPLAEKIKECQEKHSKTYGYRRVHILLEKQGIHHNPKTILRVCKNTICYQKLEERSITITAKCYINMIIFLTGILMQISLIKSG